MKNVMNKTILREIKGSFGRWISILAIIALGVGFFCGLKMCKDDFLATAQDYVTKQNLYNFQLISTLGLEDEDVNTIKETEGVKDAVGTYSSGFIVNLDNEDSQYVAKVHTLTDKINKLSMVEGKLPESKNQCVADARYFSEDDIGKSITFSSENEEDTLDMLKVEKVEIVGIANSPVYMNQERGSTSLGGGNVSFFIYLPEESWDSEVYTEIYVDAQEDYPIFSDEYNRNDDILETALEDSLASCGTRRYNSIVSEAQSELDDAKAELKKAEDELKDAQAQLDDGKKDLEDAQKELTSHKKDLEDGKKDLADGEKKLKEGKAELEDAKKQYADGVAQLDGEESDAMAQLDGAYAAGYISQQEYEASKIQYQAQFDMARKKLDEAAKEIAEGEKEIVKNEKLIADSRLQIEDAEKKIQDGQKEIDEGKAEIKKNQEKISDAQVELNDAKKELDKAQDEINDIETPDNYVLGRNTNIGYSCFENDSKIVDSIAKVFPVFFFMVAALVCMTTMTRMIDEQRTQIGVLKALGYSRGQILKKYTVYSASAAFIGSLIGYFSCIHLFPYFIWDAYGMMYGFADIIFLIDWPLFIISLLAALLCSVGTTVICCSSEMREVPAQLIRPKAPKAGKRILLERIPVIWNKLSFLVKISIRNTFRYKKRFFMMVLGISGCTALLITGLGIRDSIGEVVPAQYEEIYYVDYTLSFNDDMDEKKQQEFSKDSSSLLSDSLFINSTSVDITTNTITKTANMIVIDKDLKDSQIRKFVDLHNAVGNISYPETGKCVINQNLADILSLSVGDTITAMDSDMNAIDVEIADICDNYVNNYVYINDVTYEKQIGKVEINSALAIGKETDDPYQVAAQLSEIKHVSTVSATQEFKDRIDSLLTGLNYIVILIVISAGALAFIVLYNLTNINITERVREIATIKVLGFYKSETASYVFRENILLTAISAIVGLPVGKLLHTFVMSQVKIDAMSFCELIKPSSYIFGVIVTFIFAALVNIVMTRKIDKISMIESLKSIE